MYVYIHVYMYICVYKYTYVYICINMRPYPPTTPHAGDKSNLIGLW